MESHDVPNTTRFVMVAVAAVRLGVPAASLKREAEEGRVPSIRAGRSILVNPETVRAALLARATQASGGAVAVAIPTPGNW